MNHLEEEIEIQWADLREKFEQGRLEELKVKLNSISGCDKVFHNSQLVAQSNSELSPYGFVANFRNGEVVDEYRDVIRLLKEKEDFLKGCIDDRLEFIVEGYLERGDLSGEFFESTVKACEILGYETGLETLNRLRDDFEKWEVDLEERFRENSFREVYDEEYFDLKNEFDNVNLDGRKSLKVLNDLAKRSHRLIEKYKSIDDEDGINKSARLHEEVEDAAEKVAPIYESWKRKHVTIGLVLLTGFFGFWKGDYFKQQFSEYFMPSLQASVESSIDKVSEAGSSLENLTRPEAPHFFKSLDGKYAIHLDVSSSRGRLYDLEDDVRVDNIVISGGLREVRPGDYQIISRGEEDGVKYWQLDSLNIFGTSEAKVKRRLLERRYTPGEDIFMDYDDMLDIESKIDTFLDKTYVIVRR